MTSPSRAPLGAVATMVAGFVMIGLAEGSLGIAWPAMREGFGQPLAAIAFLLYATTIGYLVTSLALAHLAMRVPTGPLLVVAPACGALGAATVAVAPVLVVAVAGAFLLGAASAGVDGRLNTYTSVHLGPHLLNVMHGGFGVGAFVGPLGVTALLAAGVSWRWAYGALAVFDLGLVLAFVALRRRWLPLSTVHEASPMGEHTEVDLASGDELVEVVTEAPVAPVATDRPGGPDRPGSPPPPVAGLVPEASGSVAPRPWPMVLAVAGFFAYTGVEVSCGYWAFELLTARGLATGAAGVITSVYWASLMIGRFVLAGFGRRVRPTAVLALSAAGALVGTLVIAVGGAASAVVGAAGFVVTGIALSGIFPAMVAMTPVRFGAERAARLMGVQLAAASLGVATVPSAVALVAQRWGSPAIAPALVATAVLFAGVHVAVTAATRRPPSAPTRPRPVAADV